MRGNFKFNTNHHPIQDIYVREVVKEGDVLTNKIVATASPTTATPTLRTARCRLACSYGRRRRLAAADRGTIAPAQVR